MTLRFADLDKLQASRGWSCGAVVFMIGVKAMLDRTLEREAERERDRERRLGELARDFAVRGVVAGEASPRTGKAGPRGARENAARLRNCARFSAIWWGRPG